MDNSSIVEPKILKPPITSSEFSNSVMLIQSHLCIYLVVDWAQSSNEPSGGSAVSGVGIALWLSADCQCVGSEEQVLLQVFFSFADEM